MSGIVRKLVIFAGVDGLVLQPLVQKDKRGPASPVRVAYKDNTIVPFSKDAIEGDAPTKGFEAFGIVGLLTFAQSSFLISIIRRHQVAQIQGKPIYVITEVALTPLASRAEAEASISNTRASLSKRAGTDAPNYSDSDEDDVDSYAAVSDDVDDDTPLANPTPIEHHRANSIAEDVIARKGGYGRFAQNWFSKGGWTVGQRRNLGMSYSEPNSGSHKDESTTISQLPVADVSSPKGVDPNGVSTKSQGGMSTTKQLLPKLLRTVSILFGTSQSFYFSYDWDITRSFAARSNSSMEQPDPLYFWNRHLLQPFSDADQSSLVLPIMQGFVGQKAFEVDTHPPGLGRVGTEKSSLEMVDFSTASEQDESNARHDNGHEKTTALNTQKAFLLTLISRRSVKRAGLRYLRRGINDEGDTANTVETEQILSDVSWEASKKIRSFIQIRGSVPIYFSQSPYSFKPVPQLQHSEETNFRAFTKHFQALNNKYGDVQIASLVEKHGNEAIVGDAFEKHYKHLKETSSVSHVTAEFWDFHSHCKGMRFENVDILLDLIADKLESFGYTVQANNRVLEKQSGVLRTNCMDCLDRTNVVQSACGRRALELQLKQEGIDTSLQVDQATQWFNDLWADNGDACSKAYASTSAMKGDYTRTRKRAFQGALKDMGISISRFYSGIINDYFSQAAIDYLLGNVTSDIWSDFEANLMTGDPAVSMHRLRQQAIENCQKIVIADDQEELIGGWNLLTPQVANTIKSSSFEEAVLLLTDAALYLCKLDWASDKVSSFERVDLQHISSIKYGTYITATLSTSQIDEQRNVGFVVTYKAGVHDIARVNSRAVGSIESRDQGDLLEGSSSSPQTLSSTTPASAAKAGADMSQETRVLALKALSSRPAVAGETAAGLSEIDQVKMICSEIERIVFLGPSLIIGTTKKSLVEAGDVISLAEARKSTGLLEQISYSLKKLVWA